MTKFLNLKFVVKSVLVLPLLFTLVSCGSQKPMVSDIQVVPQYVDNDVYVSISADLSLGNVTLPQVGFPIYMPKTFEEIGNLTMLTTVNGGNKLNIEINLSSIIYLEAREARLPNGSILPLIGTNKTIEIPIQDKLILYVTFGDGVAAVGVAIPFSTLDGLGRSVGTTSLFPVFNIKNVFGAAGLYTSKEAGKNGFGLFADISNVMEPVMFLDLGESISQSKSMSQRFSEKTSASLSEKVNLNYSSIIPSSSKEKKINREMYKLHSKRKRLSI